MAKPKTLALRMTAAYYADALLTGVRTQDEASSRQAHALIVYALRRLRDLEPDDDLTIPVIDGDSFTV